MSQRSHLHKVHPIRVGFILALSSLVAVLLSACSSQPGWKETLRASSLESDIVQGTQYQHRLILNHLASSPVAMPPGGTLHIYIEGDGRPWIRSRVISDDPTPHQPIALKLMQLDQHPALYLGRPCYFDLANSVNCTPMLWTSHRYSKAVIDSMAHVVRLSPAYAAAEHIVLIGFSGGGTLAVLIAPQLDKVREIITVAANLDTQLWTELRGFTPLFGSENPVHYIDKVDGTKQRHLAGKDDKQVPVEVTRAFANRLSNPSLHIYSAFDHHCCWEDIWPEILQTLKDSP